MVLFPSASPFGPSAASASLFQGQVGALLREIAQEHGRPVAARAAAEMPATNRSSVDDGGLSPAIATDSYAVSEASSLEAPRLRFLSWLYATKEHQRIQQGLPKVWACRLALSNTSRASMWVDRGCLQVAIVTTTAVDAESFSREVVPWLLYQVFMGVSKVYFYYDGTDQQVMEALPRLEMIDLVIMKDDRGYQDGYSNFSAGKYLDGRPGNYVLMKKQRYNCELAIVKALTDRMVCLAGSETTVLRCCLLT
eukprot:scaffold1328_cov394-Prasinococcus_capsulatus_cf.AAC.25